MLKHRAVVLVACLVATIAVPATLRAQGAAGKNQAAAADAWVAKAPKLATTTLTVTNPGFSLEYPKKDWIVVPGGGAATVVLAQAKGNASVIVERVVLKAELGPDDITDLFAQLETESIQQRAPKAADFRSKVLDVTGGRLVAVQYALDGSKGPERVRQYSIPVGTNLYRLTCAAPIGQFQIFDPVFAHIAASFMPARSE